MMRVLQQVQQYRLIAATSLGLLFVQSAKGSDEAGSEVSRVVGNSSLAGRSFEWPTAEQFFKLLSLQDYNVRVVVLGTTLLGCAAGMVGSFTLLRKRALMGDALAHSTLPGIVVAYMLVTLLGGDGK